MKIEKIKIENFRGILEADLEFDGQLNVFIGGNGAGKTTILEAIGISIYKIIQEFLPEGDFFIDNHHFTPSNSDINYTKNEFQLFSNYKFINNEEAFSIFIQQGAKFESQKENERNRLLNGEFGQLILEKLDKKSLTVPVLKFYPSNRNGIVYKRSFDHELDDSVYPVSQMETWSNFYHETISYSKFFKWFYEHETQELRLKRDKSDINIESKELKPIRKVVKKVFKILKNKEYLIKSNQFKRFGSNELIPTISLENEVSKETEDINAKSDGEKAIITLIADIAYNLSIAKDFSEDDDYLNSSGIVLIDEIEAHLHPTWQRKIIPLLTELFPNIQFFITTHSPQVIASVDSQNVFVCEDFKFSKIGIRTKGLDSNNILKYVFNATDRPKKYVDELERFDALLENDGAIDELEAIISNVEKLDNGDNGQDIGLLVSDLRLQLEAYKFELEHETHP